MPRRPTPLTRRIILIAAVLVVGVLVATRGLDAWRELRNRLHMRELQRICMEHTWPAEWVVYDDDPQALKTRDPAFIRGHFIGEHKARAHVSRRIPAVVELMNRDEWFPPLFVHGRRKGHGQTLATVQIGARFEAGSSPIIGIAAISIAPITPFGHPPPIGNYCMLNFPDHSNDASVRFFAGQPDPEDDTRFTIPFEVNRDPGVLEGRVADDGQITLTILSGPGRITNEPLKGLR